jgi:hypothetical protein
MRAHCCVRLHRRRAHGHGICLRVKQPPCCLQARLDTAACEPETLAQPLMVSHWILLLHGIVAAHLATLALCTQHAVLSAAATRALQTLLHAHDGLYTTAARIMLSAAKRNFASQLQPALSLLNDLQGVLKLPLPAGPFCTVAAFLVLGIRTRSQMVRLHVRV